MLFRRPDPRRRTFSAWFAVVLVGSAPAAGEPNVPRFLCAARPQPDSISRTASIPGDETLGEQRTLVTLVHFTHDPSEPYSVAEIHEEILDEANPDSTASYVREASYERAWLTGSVEGWFAASFDDADCTIWQTAKTQQLIDELDPSIDFSQLDRWIIVAPHNSNCGFNGISSVGKQTYSTDEGTVEMSRSILNGAELHPAYVAAHELGHGLGLRHASDYECGDDIVDDGCVANGLGSLTDFFDIMGHPWVAGHLSPPNKLQLGWLDTEIADVAPPGGTFVLRPYAVQSSGTKVLRVPVSWTLDDLYGGDAYYVAYRTRTGFDANLDELEPPGAMVHLDAHRFRGGTPGSSRLLDMTPHADASASEQLDDSKWVLLGVGETFVDAEHGISIQATSASASNLVVSIAISQYCGNGVVDTGIEETCDGENLAGADCSTLGFANGILGCDPSCRYDTSLCGLPRCGPGHGYGPTDACSVTFVSDDTDTSLWRSRPTWTQARESSTATDEIDETYLYMLNFQRLDGWSWIYRDALPFDTTPIPDGRTVLSAELALKVLDGAEFDNSHPELADQLVLVRADLESPPDALLDDFDRFGALDDPIEGAPRIDLSDSVVPGDVVTFALNPDGISWIDSTGWTLLGIRGGYDVDDVTVPGEEVDLRLNFRAHDSPIYGPRLSVAYESLPLPAGGAAGEVPDGTAGEPLAVDRLVSGELRLDWSASCASGDSDYAVYRGVLGDFSAPEPIACSTLGEPTATFVPTAGDAFFLVVPRTADHEGSYGASTAGPRPTSPDACVPQAVTACE